MAESTGLLNLHTGNRITSSNLVLSAKKSGLQASVSHFFYLISQKISHFLNFGRKRTCAVMSRFVRNEKAKPAHAGASFLHRHS